MEKVRKELLRIAKEIEAGNSSRVGKGIELMLRKIKNDFAKMKADLDEYYNDDTIDQTRMDKISIALEIYWDAMHQLQSLESSSKYITKTLKELE